MRVLFFGYGGAGAAALEVLRGRGDTLAAVVTHRDDPGERLPFTTPARVAARLGIKAPLLYGEDLSPCELEGLAQAAAPDLVLSVFYRRLLPAGVLESARVAALNVHPSLLPRYRGRATINWVILTGERETGVTLHHMTEKPDAGDIVAQVRIPIDPRETAATLYEKVTRAGAELLREWLPRVERGEAPRKPQDPRLATYFGRRRPEDGRIDWSRSAKEIDRLVRAVAPPWPGAFSELELPGLGRRLVTVEAGEPVAALPGAPSPAAPGTVLESGGRLYVACGKGWFRIDHWSFRGPEA